MRYKTILVNLHLDSPVTPSITYAVDLAKRCGATLVGFCAADVPMPVMTPEDGVIAEELWTSMKDDVQARIYTVRATFQTLLGQTNIEHDWLDAVDSPTSALIAAARRADLIITSAFNGADTGDFYRIADPGSVVLQAGRPVLVPAFGAERPLLDKAIVAWKDTREARRAVADAVPLLSMADDVTVVAVSDAPDDEVKAGLHDVAAFLASHGIAAKTRMLKDRHETARLSEFIKTQHADLVVAGAYGHSRLREWVFGGVTRNLLDDVGRNRLLSS